MDTITAQTPEEGAQTFVYLASSPEVEGLTGNFFRNQQAIPSSDTSYDQQVVQQLWRVSEQMTSLNG